MSVINHDHLARGNNFLYYKDEKRGNNFLFYIARILLIISNIMT